MKLGLGVRGRLARRRANHLLRVAAGLAPYVLSPSDRGTYVMPVREARKLLVAGTRGDMVVFDRAVETLTASGRCEQLRHLVDVGANFGTTSVAALVHHGFERVVAIEPDPENLRLLRANLALNGVEDLATVVPAAASASEGSAAFRRGFSEGVWKSGSGRLGAAEAGGVSVATVSLDSVVAGSGLDLTRTLLWIDVQGHEPEVLEGATALLRASCPGCTAVAVGSLF